MQCTNLSHVGCSARKKNSKRRKIILRKFSRLFPGPKLGWPQIGTPTPCRINCACLPEKRGLQGTFQQVSEKHLGRYCDEFSYRFNLRKMQPQLFAYTKNLLYGERLTYCFR